MLSAEGKKAATLPTVYYRFTAAKLYRTLCESAVELQYEKSAHFLEWKQKQELVRRKLIDARSPEQKNT
jgi:hypothetical protein